MSVSDEELPAAVKVTNISRGGSLARFANTAILDFEGYFGNIAAKVKSFNKVRITEKQGLNDWRALRAGQLKK